MKGNNTWKARQTEKQRDRETGRQGERETGTQRHRGTGTQYLKNVSQWVWKFCILWTILEVILTRPIRSVWTQLLYFLCCHLSSNDKQTTSYSLNKPDQHCLFEGESKYLLSQRSYHWLEPSFCNMIAQIGCKISNASKQSSERLSGFSWNTQKWRMENWGHLLYLHLIGSLWIDCGC